MEYGTLERRALQDCVYLRDIGGNPVLYCQRNSPISEEAAKQDIPIIHYTGRALKRNFEFTYLSDLRELLKENRYDLIHCYGSSFVWMICMALIGNPKIPLLLTENNNAKVRFKGMLYRWLVRRIDLVLVSSNSISSQISDFLPVSSRKVKIAGGGVEVGKRRHMGQHDKKVIGTFLVRNALIYKKVELILYAIPYLLKKTQDLSFETEFVFYCDMPWVTVKEFPRIQELIEELNVGHVVKFEHIKTGPDQVIQSFDIYIGTEFEEPFNDFEIMALLYFVPTVLPRTAARQELLVGRRLIGESYHYYDSRELKDKLLKIILDEPLYITHIQEFHEMLSEQHGMESYCERLIEFYENNYEKRIRISERMNKNISKGLS